MLRNVHGLLEGSVPDPKIIGGVRTPATPPVAEPMNESSSRKTFFGVEDD